MSATIASASYWEVLVNLCHLKFLFCLFFYFRLFDGNLYFILVIFGPLIPGTRSCRARCTFDGSSFPDSLCFLCFLWWILAIIRFFFVSLSWAISLFSVKLSGREIAYIARGVELSSFVPNFARLQFLTQTAWRLGSIKFEVDVVDSIIVPWAKTLNNRSRSSLNFWVHFPNYRKKASAIVWSRNRVTFIVWVEVTTSELRLRIVSLICPFDQRRLLALFFFIASAVDVILFVIE